MALSQTVPQLDGALAYLGVVGAEACEASKLEVRVRAWGSVTCLADARLPHRRLQELALLSRLSSSPRPWRR